MKYYCIGCNKYKTCIIKHLVINKLSDMTKDKLIICKWCREQWHYFYVGDRMGFLKRHQDKVIKDSIERILALQESRRLMALADKLDKEAIAGMIVPISVDDVMPTEDEDTLHAEQLYRQAIQREKENK